MPPFLIYSESGDVTGPRLAQYLGIPSGREAPTSERVTHLIRWGTTRRVRYVPSVRVINTKKALSESTNKLKALRRLKQAGIPVPPFNTEWYGLEFPLLGRSINHEGGSDIHLCLQPFDIERQRSQFYVQFIPKKREYRVHVFGGEIIKVSQKKLREEKHYNPVCWNLESGWRFCSPEEDHPCVSLALAAIGAFGLDFGAADILLSADDRPYVLEVNAAPGLQKDVSFEPYARRLQSALGLEEVPGNNAVDWEDES